MNLNCIFWVSRSCCSTFNNETTQILEETSFFYFVKLQQYVKENVFGANFFHSRISNFEIGNMFRELFLFWAPGYIQIMPGLHSRWDSMRRAKNESVKGTFFLSVMFSICSCVISREHVDKSVPSQRKRECLECLTSLSKVLWSHSHSDLQPFTGYLYWGEIFLKLSTIS